MSHLCDIVTVFYPTRKKNQVTVNSCLSLLKELIELIGLQKKVKYK